MFYHSNFIELNLTNKERNDLTSNWMDVSFGVRMSHSEMGRLERLFKLGILYIENGAHGGFIYINKDYQDIIRDEAGISHVL